MSEVVHNPLGLDENMLYLADYAYQRGNYRLAQYGPFGHRETTDAQVMARHGFDAWPAMMLGTGQTDVQLLVYRKQLLKLTNQPNYLVSFRMGGTIENILCPTWPDLHALLKELTPIHEMAMRSSERAASEDRRGESWLMRREPLPAAPPVLTHPLMLTE
jgi:hypothetical protein